MDGHPAGSVVLRAVPGACSPITPASRFLGDTRLTGYFLPLEQTKRELAEKGVPEERIRVTGIPVDPRFRIHPDKRETRRALSLPEGGGSVPHHDGRRGL